MKRVFKEVGSLDRKCYEEFDLTEDILMEHAAEALKREIERSEKGKDVLIVCGPGNNGADGITLSRMIKGDFNVEILLPYGAKSKMAKLQLQRARKLNVKEIEKIDKEYDIIVDAIFGSGMNRELDDKIVSLIDKLNSMKAYKIACDIPSGIDFKGNISKNAFIADITVTMGALKESLFTDLAKDFVGEIKVANLGVSSAFYEGESSTFLLEKEDLNLPVRERKNTHKGDFGHLAVICGKKHGASIIASKAAFSFGSGLVTLVCNEIFDIPYEIMSSSHLPSKCNAVCIGMGLGYQYDDELLHDFVLNHPHPVIIDADIFHNEFIKEILQKKRNLVLTPHPKEFASLLEITGIAKLSLKEIQENRFSLVREFCGKYQDVVLLLKGANTLIGQNEKIFINPYGSNALSKGGSGDVLSGLIGALLAQKREPLNAAINASLAHSLSSLKFNKNNYSLTPFDLIEGIKCL